MEELYKEIKIYYSYQGNEILQTNVAIQKINRFFVVNNKENLSRVLKESVRRYGSIGFMKELEKQGIIKKAPGYCDCNGGTWRKKGE
jgi:hypothetical protein